jgi:membrane fusion protein (multidrug efflux system)
VFVCIISRKRCAEKSNSQHIGFGLSLRKDESRPTPREGVANQHTSLRFQSRLLENIMSHTFQSLASSRSGSVFGSATALRTAWVPSAALAVLLITGCGNEKADVQAAAAAPPPPEVAVIKVAPQSITLTEVLPGRVEASRTAQVRARVPGIVQKRVFTEGSTVKAGDVLFRIDQAPFRATLSSTEAALARAEANLAQANLQVKRFKPLVKEAAISQQEFDNAVTAQKQAQADVAAARAAKQTASLNLGYATVTAPISGRIGRAQVTEGALVGQGEATPLATIQQIDPVYVNMTQSSAQLMSLRRALAEGKLEKGGEGAKITLMTEDGQRYPQTGTLLFSDVSVDPTTGSVTLRATVPNKDRSLLPGMYVRAQVNQAVQESAIVVPQQAVMRSAEGSSVLVVGGDNKVARRPVTVSRAKGNEWIISEGLKQGDTVIVEGLQKAKPDAVVKPVAWNGPTGTVAAVNVNSANGAVVASESNTAANPPPQPPSAGQAGASNASGTAGNAR